MNQVSLSVDLSSLGHPEQRIMRAIEAIQQGHGVIVVDDESRENEGDIIFPAETMTPEQMNLMIRTCSGIVCLVLTAEKVQELDLPPMVSDNSSRFSTPFTVSVEAKEGVTTGVSAADRVTTIRAAIADAAHPSDLARPGHIFPLRAHPDGLLARRGHTEATVELMRLAGRKPYGVLCEVMNPDGTMARLPELISFACQHDFPIVTIDDLVMAIEKRN